MVGKARARPQELDMDLEDGGELLQTHDEQSSFGDGICSGEDALNTAEMAEGLEVTSPWQTSRGGVREDSLIWKEFYHGGKHCSIMVQPAKWEKV